ncbi:hypothetical protein SISSUDRAFT_458317 [Sistotremastrum suecicum HHB10207 ss-3]|uniref:Secreted protein n=1 Tax=Sistotremastrum suecicum HHB10207 ss-3 TaxID=1314776 RepID=A0A165Y6Q7_9AGAM|nr:hypothetical protein SISSUDRAFT_458317 [Sistotremastrum suecicum HHB10207 ss-3]
MMRLLLLAPTLSIFSLRGIHVHRRTSRKKKTISLRQHADHIENICFSHTSNRFLNTKCDISCPLNQTNSK